VEKRHESSSNDLGDDLVDDITKADRAKMLNRRGPKLLWAESNKSVILLFEKVIIPEKKFQTALRTVSLIQVQYFI
jgi:hypothetical protein